MDKLITHWGPIPRRFPARFRLQTVGCLPRKQEWVKRSFGTVNFSLILNGGGEYHAAGRQWEVRAPCIITQWPGEPLRYGPTGGSQSWDEIYLIFHPGQEEAFREAGFLCASRPAWRIRQFESVGRLIDQLLDLSRTPTREGAADRVDRLAEGLLLESLLGEPGNDSDPAARAVLQLRRRIREQPSLQPDWEAEATRNGIAPATFRRHWQRLVGDSPNRYLTAVRMREARRLLVETRLPVATIAEQVGYEDPLYFSRRFREQVGVTARDYRREHQRRDAILFAG